MALHSSSGLLVAANALVIGKSLASRQDYRGGWPLGYTGAECPSNSSVTCTTSFGVGNLNCCPDGQSCFRNLDSKIYCCPSDADCGSAVVNRPTCADPSWKLYDLELYGYFCCPEEYVGVLPIQGTGGLCESNAEQLPKKRLAKLVATTAAPDSGGPSLSQPVAQSTSSRLTVPAAGRETGDDTSGGSGQDRESNGAGNTSIDSEMEGSRSSTSAGAIAGIVIGSIVLVALCAAAILWYHRRSLRRHGASSQKQESQRETATAQPTQSYQEGLIPAPATRAPGPTPPPPPGYSEAMYPSAVLCGHRPNPTEVARTNDQQRPELRDTQRPNVAEAGDTQRVHQVGGHGVHRVEMPIGREI
jgi:hypothetical protein